MKKQIKKLALLVFMGLIASCSTPEIESVDEKLLESQIEIVEEIDGKDWQIPEDNTPGIYGPSTLDAYQNGTYTYKGSPEYINQIPANLRKYRFGIWQESLIGPPWTLKATYELNSNKITIKFPRRNNTGRKTKWAVGCQAFNKNTGKAADYHWKAVNVNNN